MNSASRCLLKCAKSTAVLRRSLRPAQTSLFTSRSVVTSIRNQKTGNVNVAKPQLLTNSARFLSSATNFEVINVQDEQDFEKRVLKASCETPVIVDFHATWCGPCKILGPRLESILSKEEGKVVMAKVDIDEQSDIAMEYGVRSVPTVLAVKNGKVQDQFVGALDNDQIQTFVDKLMVS